MRSFLRILSIISALTLLTVGVSAENSPTDSTILWSDDTDNCTVDPAETDTFGALAECTDITYSTPPTDAGKTTSEFFEQIESLGPQESAHPNGATLASSGPIRDAHATVFSVGPSTVSHITSDETIRYVAPSGTLRALIDYRIELPDTVENENETITWDLEATEIESVRFGVDNETRGVSQSSTPTFQYSLTGNGERKLWVEARISATVEKTSERRTANQTVTKTSDSEYRITVRDSVDVHIYRPSYDVAVARTPSATGLVAVTASQPYADYTVATDTNESVQNVWRFYTAGSDAWQTMTRTTDAGHETMSLHTRPVVVHAYPARPQPIPAPLSHAIRVHDRSTWTEVTAPDLPNTIAVDIVDSTYRRPETLVTDHSYSLQEELSITGLVAGTTTTIDTADGQHISELQPTSVETAVLSKNKTTVVLSVTVWDTATANRIRPGRHPGSVGILTTRGTTEPIDADGTTTITVPARGVSTISYKPKAWDSGEIAYLPSTERVAFHPLTSLSGWVSLGVDILIASAPFVVVFVAGRQLGRLFDGEDHRW